MAELGRRRHRRFSLSEPFWVRIQSPAGAGGSLLNVSLAGLAFAAEAPPQEGDLLTLDVADAHGTVRLPALHAHVVATSETGGQDRVVHCAFIDVEEPEQLLAALGAR